MKKTIIILGIFIAALFGGYLVVSAAPTVIYQRTILPQTDSTYELGTSTKAWLRATTDELCLNGDCRTAWGGAAGASSTPIDYIVYNDAGVTKGFKTATNVIISSNANADVVLRAILANATSTASAPYATSIHVKSGTYTLSSTTTFPGDETDYGPSWTLIGDGIEATRFVVSNTGGFNFTDRPKINFRNFSMYLNGSANGISSKSGASGERSFWKSTIDSVMFTATNTSHYGYAMLLGNPLRNNYNNIQILHVGNGIKEYSENSSFNPGDSVYSNVQCNLKTNTVGNVCYNFDGSLGSIVNQDTFIDVNASNDIGSKTAWRLNNTKWQKAIGLNVEGFTTTTELYNGSYGNYFEYNYVIASSTGSTFFSTMGSSVSNSFGCSYLDTPTGTYTVFTDTNTDTKQPNLVTGLNGTNCKLIGLGTFSFATSTASVVNSSYNSITGVLTNQIPGFVIPFDNTSIPSISVGTGANASNYVMSYSSGRGMQGYDVTSGNVIVNAGNDKGISLLVNGTNNSFNSGTNALSIQGNVANGTVGSIGFGITNPAAHLHAYLATGTSTIRNDSGSTQGIMYAFDGDNTISFGSLSSSSVKGIFNNSARTLLYGPNNQGTTFQINCPPESSANCQGATLSTMLDMGSGNKEWTDWTTENYGVDHLHSITLAKAGTGTILPLVIRGWNQGAGLVHAVSVPVAFFDPNKGVTAIGSYSSTTYSGTIPLQVASSTATTVFAVDAAAGSHVFTVTPAGLATSVGLISSASSSIIGGLQVGGMLNTSSSQIITGSLMMNQTAGTFNSGKFGIDSSGNINTSGTLTLANNSVITSPGSTITLTANSVNALWDGTNNTFRAGSNNTRDLGSHTIAWRSIFASTSIFSGGTVTINASASTAVTSSGKVYMNTLSSAQGNFVCRNASTNEITDGGATSCAPSSRRFKENIQPYEGGLATIMQLKPSIWNYKPSYRIDPQQHISFIAEDAYAVDPRLVGLDREGKPLNLDGNAFMGVAIKAIQELNLKVDRLQKEKDQQQTEIKELKKEIKILKYSN